MITRAELRSALRGLGRSPMLSAAAVLCLALGMGATTAVSSAVSRALLRPLPLRDEATLVAVHRVTPNSGPQGTWPESPANYLDLARGSRQVQGLSALHQNTSLVSLGLEAVQVSDVLATGGLFPMLGAVAQRGRLFGSADDRLDAPRVVVISDDFWRAKLGADPSAIGRAIEVDGSPTTVIGVLPPEFRVPQGGFLYRADLWLPMRMTPKEAATRGNNYLKLIGRLAPGATLASAEAEERALFAGILSAHHDLVGENVRVAPLQAENLASVRKPLLLLAGAVVMVLLIACTNVAALLLARGVQRRRESAVRTALGATRSQVMRPALVESTIITVAGLALALVIAFVSARTIGALAAARMPQLAGLTLDRRVLLLSAVMAVVVALVCGAAPAWRSGAVDPQDALRGGRGGGTGREAHRALEALVALEICLSLVLVIGAGLVLNAFAQLTRKDPGFAPEHLLSLRVTVAATRYPDHSSAARMLEPTLAAISAIPGVRAAGSIDEVPYEDWGNNSNIRYEGMSDDQPSRQPLVEQRSVSPSFFRVTAQRLIAGRLLLPSDGDRAAAPQVVVVNEALAKRDFPHASAVGKRFYISDTSFATIVGVVSDIRNVGPVADPQPEMYWTYGQSSPGATEFPILVRTSGDPTAVVASVRSAIRSVDASAAVSNVQPMAEVMAASLGRPRFYLSLLGSFAAVALILGIAGLYGVLSYAVAQRTREIGIRSALGSPRGAILRLITLHGVRLVLTGLVLGLIGGAVATRFMTSMLYGVSPLDARTWAAAVGLMLITGTVACLVPARRATRVDALVAIQAE